MRRTADYRYQLPPERIAQVPVDRRDHSRLLEVTQRGCAHRRFDDLAELLPEHSILVLNDTKVVPARLRGHKASGGAVELLLLGPHGESDRDTATLWRCLAKSSKPLRSGQSIAIAGATLRVAQERDQSGELLLDLPLPAPELLARSGELPLPPYITRNAGPTAADAQRYQTVFARHPGAVAAPTAGLHFTTELLERLTAERDVVVAPLTLHVGPGTFQPVRADQIDDHRMHPEPYRVPATTAALVQSGRPVVAVGTTAVRALEAAARDGTLARRDQSFRTTDLFITPGFRFALVDHLVTNFHLPESTLLMLVCAFGGYRRVIDAYREALGKEYRFGSYGDAMLLARDRESGPP
jgi:S-adenosylmethionine:tRNA ribosyltransferase-isomerase